MAVPDKSSKDYKIYLAACVGKEAFEDFDLANKVLKSRKIASARQVYRCSYCGKIHIGFSDRRNRK